MKDRIHEGAIRDEIAAKTGDSKALLRDFSNELFNSIRQALLDDGHVRLHQFGSFKLKWTKERNGKNPQTGEPLIIPAHPRIVFTPAKALKEQVADASKISQINETVDIKPPPPSETIENELKPETVEMSTNNPEPYLTKNIKKHSQEEAKSSFPTSIVAALLIALAVLYFFFKPDTNTKQLANNKTTLVQHTEVTKIEQPIETAETQVADSVKIETPVIASTEETITLDPEILNYANDAAQSEQHEIADESAAIKDAIIKAETSPIESKPFFAEKPHELLNGDSLWRLSKKNYINPFYWPHIYQANKLKIRNPNKLLIGKIIQLPTMYGHPDNLTNEDKRNIAEGYFLVYRYHKKTNKPFPYFALLGVMKFDKSVIDDHIYEIDEEDWNSLKIASN